MKVKSANKKLKSSKGKNSSKNIFESGQKSLAAKKDVDLIDVEVISSPSTKGKSGRMELSVSSVSKKLVSEGFEKVEIVSDTEVKKKVPKKATAEDIDKLFDCIQVISLKYELSQKPLILKKEWEVKQ